MENKSKSPFYDQGEQWVIAIVSSLVVFASIGMMSSVLFIMQLIKSIFE